MDNPEDTIIDELVSTLTISNMDWSAWELEFIESMRGKKWRNLTEKQRGVVMKLYESI